MLISPSPTNIVIGKIIVLVNKETINNVLIPAKHIGTSITF